MESGDPNDLFDAAEQYGKVFAKLAEGVLAAKKILPTYQDARRVGQAAPSQGRRGPGTARRPVNCQGLERTTKAAVPDAEGGRPVHL